MIVDDRMSTGEKRLQAFTARLPTSLVTKADITELKRRPRLIAGQSYSPTIQQSFSGSTYYFASAAMQAGLAEGVFGFIAPGGARNIVTKSVGAMWKAKKAAQRRRTSGFKFSEVYLDMAWARVAPALRGCDVISNFQLVSPKFLERRHALDVGLTFFVDGTLLEYFTAYGEFEAGNVDPTVVARALELEGIGYRNADRVIAMSRCTAETIIEHYGVDESRVTVVEPGANLFDSDIPERPQDPDPLDFTLCFVGIYPLRKGLDRLLQAVSLLRSRDRRVKLRIIGDAPAEMRDADGVEFLGRIDKAVDAARFVRATSTAHFGCLLSKAELGGIGLVESFRVGVPGLGTGVGGMKDILQRFGGVIASPDLDTEGLAAVIGGFMDQPHRYAELRAHAVQQRSSASWTRAAREIDEIFAA